MLSLKSIAAVLIVSAAIIAAGCLSLGQSQQSSTETVSRGSGGLSYAVPSPAFAPATKIASDQSAAGSNADQGVETKIIKTGQITIEVPDVPAAIDRIGVIAVSNGGYLSTSSIDTSQNDRKTGYVMIRIPAENFDTVMQALSPLGKVLSSSEQRSDVTAQYIDLSIQNASLHNQLDGFNRIMAKATNVEDIIKIQVEIDRVTMTLNQIEGQLRYLSSQIDLSTITVTLQEPEPVGGETGYNIVTAINDGIAGFFGMISALIVFIFSVIPLIILGLIAYAVYRWHQKRKGAGTPPPAEVKKEG
ncbi:MAG: DUF4349 domain-containing protein [Methanomicrobiales archaeon]|jgi:hypothetical protein